MRKFMQRTGVYHQVVKGSYQYFKNSLVKLAYTTAGTKSDLNWQQSHSE